jgi:acyl-CoA thioester hydrolase
MAITLGSKQWQATVTSVAAPSMELCVMSRATTPESPSKADDSAAQDPRLWSSPMGIEPEWVDYNGHLNMAYYNVLFDRGADQAFAHFGIGPDYLATRGFTTFTAEAHVSYIREVKPDEKVRIATRILDFDAKRFHFFQQMYGADAANDAMNEGSDNDLRATSENISLHVHHAGPKVTAMPDDIHERLDAIWRRHANLPNAPQVGHVIGIRRKR